MNLQVVGLLLLLTSIACIHCQTDHCSPPPEYTVQPKHPLSESQKSLYPYISYKGDIYHNNSVIELDIKTMIKGRRYRESVPIGCHTNLKACCSKNEGRPNGNWFDYNGARISVVDKQINFAIRLPQHVDLIHSGSKHHLGVHCCEIPTDAGNGYEQMETICVGLYRSNAIFSQVRIVFMIHLFIFMQGEQ